MLFRLIKEWLEKNVLEVALEYFEKVILKEWQPFYQTNFLRTKNNVALLAYKTQSGFSR
jgi:hypothetical protein